MAICCFFFNSQTAHKHLTLKASNWYEWVWCPLCAQAIQTIFVAPDVLKTEAQNKIAFACSCEFQSKCALGSRYCTPQFKEIHFVYLDNDSCIRFGSFQRLILSKFAMECNRFRIIISIAKFNRILSQMQ